MKKLFLTSSANTVMKDIVKNFGRSVQGLRVAFIDTASETERGDKPWLDADRDVLVERGFTVFDYSITGKTYEEVSNSLKGIDVLFVAGGNTFYLLEQANNCNFKQIVNELLEAGVTYIGSSAGTLLACPNIEPIKFLDDPNEAKDLKSYDALALVDFILLPHWGSEKAKERHLTTIDDIYDKGQKVILLTDNQYVSVEDEMYQIRGI